MKTMSVEKVPKFNGKKNVVTMWSAKEKLNMVMKFLGQTLIASFEVLCQQMNR